MLAVSSLVSCASPQGFGWRDFYDAPRSEAVGKDVQDIVIRWQGCGHLAGEEPYDAERAADIEQAFSDLKCSALETDTDAALSRHSQDAESTRVLMVARSG